jgi:hypothetical protein
MYHNLNECEYILRRRSMSMSWFHSRSLHCYSYFTSAVEARQACQKNNSYSWKRELLKKPLLMPMCKVVGVAKTIDQIINITQLESQPSRHSATTLLSSQLDPNHLITKPMSQFSAPKTKQLVIPCFEQKKKNIPIRLSSTSTSPPAASFKVHPLKLTGIVGESGNRIESPAWTGAAVGLFQAKGLLLQALFRFLPMRTVLFL